MLTGLTLERFKAFGEDTRIQLAPITLIYGENSAGKSSILQALSLLKQTLESREREPDTALLPKAEEGLIDLGSFRELLFDHDLSHSLKITLAIQPGEQTAERGLFARQPRSPLGPFEIDFKFDQERSSADVRLRRLCLGFKNNRSPFLEYETRRVRKAELERFSPYWLSPRVSRAEQRGLRYVAECKVISLDEDHWRTLYEPWHSCREDVAKAVSREFQVRNPRRRQSRMEEAISGEYEYPDQVSQAIEFYSRGFTIQQFIDRISNATYGQLSIVDGFIPRGAPFASRALPEVRLAYRLHRTPKLQHLPSLAFTENLVRAGAFVEEALNAMFPLGPFRRPPERWYMFTGTSPVDVGYRGDHLPDLLLKQAGLRKHANKWLERLEIGYQLRVRRIGGTQSDLFAVRLEDTRREEQVDVALSDVGFGISQILPFLVQCLASQQRIISIEQPEVHIHPRLQADLGNLIAETVREPYGHQFLIETHSEHLVLRMQKLIRTGLLRSEDVSIIYVSRGEAGSTARRLRLDDDGDFVDEWPGGFFPERMREFR